MHLLYVETFRNTNAFHLHSSFCIWLRVSYDKEYMMTQGILTVLKFKEPEALYRSFPDSISDFLWVHKLILYLVGILSQV